jgi:hypothetical protein
MTFREAYIYAYAVLEGYWETNPNPDLGVLLADMSLWHPLGDDSKPAKPALRNDWLKAVRKVTESDSISDTQALMAVLNLFKELSDNSRFEFKEEMYLIKQRYEQLMQVKNTWKTNRE